MRAPVTLRRQSDPLPSLPTSAAQGSRISPEDLCGFLHDLFSQFDALAEKLGVHKIETVVRFTGRIPLGCAVTWFGAAMLMLFLT